MKLYVYDRGMDSFRLDAIHFPGATRELLPVDICLELGVLPLGFKAVRGWTLKATRRLNVGVLDPRWRSRRRVRRALKPLLHGSGYGRLKLFRIDPGEFLGVLRAHYQIPEDRLGKFIPSK